MAQMGMFSNMFGINPNNLNLNADPSQMPNLSMEGDMSSMMGNPFYSGMFAGKGNSQQGSNGQLNN